MKKIGIIFLMVILIVSLGLNLFFFFKPESISLKIVYEHSGDTSSLKQVWYFISGEDKECWNGFLMHRVGENKFLATLPKKANIRLNSSLVSYFYLSENYIEKEEIILNIPKILQLARTIYF